MAFRFNRRRALCAALVLTLPGCRFDLLNPGAGACAVERYRYGADGCAKVTGRVYDEEGVPLEGVHVGAVPAREGPLVETDHPRTDARGRFELMLHRERDPGAAAHPAPDTLTVWVFAVRRLHGTRFVRDSVPVVVHFAAPGSHPVAARQNFVLASPLR